MDIEKLRDDMEKRIESIISQGCIDDKEKTKRITHVVNVVLKYTESTNSANVAFWKELEEFAG